jgi:hypothetical protein
VVFITVQPYSIWSCPAFCLEKKSAKKNWRFWAMADFVKIARNAPTRIVRSEKEPNLDTA